MLVVLISKIPPFKPSVNATTWYLPEGTGQVPEQSFQSRDGMSQGSWTPAASDLGGAESHPLWYPLTWPLLQTYHLKPLQDIFSEARNSRPGQAGNWRMLVCSH